MEDKIKIINLLTSKIFHDIGNTASFLNFYVELNKDNPKSINFDELIEINHLVILHLKLLKCAFLENAYTMEILLPLKEYFTHQNKSLEFKIDCLTLSECNLKIIANILIILNNILADD